MLYIIYQEDDPGSAALRAAHREAHFAYLETHRDIIVLGEQRPAQDKAVAMLLEIGEVRLAVRRPQCRAAGIVFLVDDVEHCCKKQKVTITGDE